VFLRRFVAWLIGARPADLAFGVRPGGKPFLARPSGADVRFNLSHAGAYCAVAGCVGRDVGVDIERERPLVDLGGVAALALSSRERAELASFAEGERPRAFFRAWALKEAYAKALGRGVVGELAVVEVSFSPDRPARLVADRTRPDAPGVWTLLEPGAPAGYVCALAVAGAAGRVARLVERVDGSVTIARGAGVPGALAAR
jgi:4'-phosphopantetheinyl transferase